MGGGAVSDDWRQVGPGRWELPRRRAVIVVEAPPRRLPRCEPRPWPLEPLLQAMGTDRPLWARAGDLGLQERQVHRLRRRGLTDEEADRLAVAAGFHPAEVWSGW